jgi:hypothetical protein
MSAIYEYGILTYYPSPQAWVISFYATNSSQSIEKKTNASAEGIRQAVFQVLGYLGEQGWVVFQVDGYTENEYPVYHLRRVRS